MDVLILPSLLAISLKIGIFIRYQNSLRRENLSLGIFFLSVFLINIVELLGINQDFPEQTMMLFLLSFYCCTIFIIHAYIGLALDYSQFKWHSSKIKTGLNLVLALLLVGLIFDRSIIAGVEAAGPSLTKVPGENYWIFQLYVVGGLFFALGLLIRGLTQLTSNIGRQQCLVILLSTSTPVLITFMVIGLQSLGVQITSVIFLSLSFTVMVAIMVFAEEKTRLFHLLTFVPFTRERKLHKQLLTHITDCIAINDDPAAQQPIQLKQMMREFEGSVVEHVLGYYGGNQKKAASALGVSEATVSRRARARARARQHHTQLLDYSTDSVRITE